MGRADLARHRKTSPSDTKPAELPRQTTAVLPLLQAHPNANVSSATSSLQGASTQRAQQAALKMLGLALRDAHIQKDDARGAPLCACRGGEGQPVCRLIDAVLADFVFAAPDATSGLVSTALRAALRAGVDLPAFEEAKASFFDRVQGATVDSTTDEKQRFVTLVTDLSATAVILSDGEVKHWIMGHPARVAGALRQIGDIVRIYTETSRSDNALPGLHLASSDGATRRINESLNRKLLESACNSAMKAAQDILNTLHKQAADAPSPDVTSATEACSSLLALPTVPRSCAMACAVAYVTGTIVLAGCTEDASAIAQVVSDRILASATAYPPFSQLSLLRAVMEAPAAGPAVERLLFPCEEPTGTTIFEKLASIATDNADVHLRFLAMDALNACIRRRAPNTLTAFCRSKVLSLVYERWQEPFPGVSAQIRETMEALVAADEGDQSTAFWIAMATTFVNGDWNSKGMYAPLSVLVSRVGALCLLELQPRCQTMAMDAAAVDSRLAKPVADWLGAFWKVLRKECVGDSERFLKITCQPLVEALVDETNSSLRERVSEHVLPVFYRSVEKDIVKEYANALLDCLAKIKSEDHMARIRGTINILSVARQNGVFIASFSDPQVFELLREALTCGEEDMRSSALDLIVTCRMQTEPVMQEELDLVLFYLPSALMPGGSMSDRSRFRHSMRRFLERLAACRHAAKDGSGGWWMRERKERYGGVRTAEFEEKRLSLLNRIEYFEKSCLSLLLASSYPGAIFSRRTSALEVMELFSRNLGFDSCFKTSGCSSEAITAAIVECLTDEWDRPRRAALQVISSVPISVLGFDSLSSAEALQEYALPLLNSVRLKDVDAGASVFRAAFRKYVLSSLKNGSNGTDEGAAESGYLSFPGEDGSPQNNTPRNTHPCLFYAESVLTSVQKSLRNANIDFMAMCERGLFHGRFLVLRNVLQDVPWKQLMSTSYASKAKSFVQRCIDLACQCTQLAMKGVSFQTFEEHMNCEDSCDLQDVGSDDRILLQERRQVQSTSCFLSMKEICVCLGILSHEVPLGGAEAAGRAGDGLLDQEQIDRIGNTFLHVFMNTRHWGVIDGAAEGMQLLCERLMQNSGVNLRSLPKEWAHEIVSCALRGDLYVLRRSAGIPSLVNAIVNAEGNSSKRAQEAPVLHGIAMGLLQHLEESHMFTDESILQMERSREEESIAHALNLLRSLFLNGNIAASILKHLEGAAICCLRAFRSASWLIRNSAMMLFAALIRRGVGVCAERQKQEAVSSFVAVGGTSATLEGERRLRGTTAFQFFSRYPKLHPFLLETLEEAVGLEGQTEADSPGLYPALYLLSCLSPAAAEDPSNAICMAPFRSVLRKFSHWRSDYVRRVAAVASVPLIEDPSRIAEVVRDLLSTVPKEPMKVVAKIDRKSTGGLPLFSPRCDACNETPGNETMTTQLQQNRLHGDLLTIGAILSTTRTVMGLKDKRDTLNVLSELLPSRIWVTQKGKLNPCSYTRAAMLSVVSESLALARDIQDNRETPSPERSKWQPLLLLYNQLAFNMPCLDVEDCGYGASAGIASLQKKALVFVADTAVVAMERGEDVLPDALKTLTLFVRSDNDVTSQVALESCVRLVSRRYAVSAMPQYELGRNSVSTGDVMLGLWESSKKLLTTSRNHEVVVSALRLLITFQGVVRFASQNEADKVAGITNDELSKILDASSVHPCVDVREYALILLGTLIGTKLRDSEFLTRWMASLESASQAQTSTTRMAAATSLANSRLGRSRLAHGEERDVLARGLLVLSRLLEDDHSDVRMHAARMTHKCLSTSAMKNGMSLNILPTLMQVFEYFVAKLSDSGSLLEYLRTLVGDASSDLESEGDMLMETMEAILNCTPSRSPQMSKGGKGLSTARRDPSRLFRLEDDSCDGEVVLRLQLVTWCYMQVLSKAARPPNVSAEAVAGLCRILTSQFEEEIKMNVEPDRPGIIGRPCFTSSGFMRCLKSLFRILLGSSCLRLADSPISVVHRLRPTQATLGKILSNHKDELHPVLYAALDGLSCELRSESGRKPLQSLFFLLPL